MKTHFRAYGFALTFVGAAHTATAQSYSPRLPERPAVGVSVGFSANADENSGLASRDVGSMFEIPLEHEWRFRIDAGRAAWRFGVAPIPDHVSLTRTTAGVIYTKVAPVVGHPVGTPRANTSRLLPLFRADLCRPQEGLTQRSVLDNQPVRGETLPPRHPKRQAVCRSHSRKVFGAANASAPHPRHEARPV
jgi:hypothetical protein